MKYYPGHKSTFRYKIDTLDEKDFLKSLEGFNFCREFYDIAHILEAGFKDYGLLSKASLFFTHIVEAKFELTDSSKYTLFEDCIGAPQSFILREDYGKSKDIILDPTFFFPEVDQNYLEKIMKYIRYWMENDRFI